MKTITPFAAYLDEKRGRSSNLEQYLSVVLRRKIHKQYVSRVKNRGSKFPSHWMKHVVVWSRGNLSLEELAEYADKV